MTGVNLGSFPKLTVSQGDDRAELFSSWRRRFSVAIDVTTVNMGNDGEGNPRFQGRLKLLALLGAIDNDGMVILETLGFDSARNDVDAYNEAMALLVGHFTQEEHEFIRLVRFTRASQACGENVRDFLTRVEKLSRTIQYPNNNDNFRQSLAVAIAVNGLSSSTLRQELLARNALTWVQLVAHVRAKTLATQSDAILTEVNVNPTDIRREIKTEVRRVMESVNLGEGPSNSTHDIEVGRVSGNSENSHRQGSPKYGYQGDRRSGRRSRDTRDSDSGDRDHGRTWSRYRSRDRSRSGSDRSGYRQRDSSRSSGDSCASYGTRHREGGRYRNYTSARGYRSSWSYESPRRIFKCYQCNREGHIVRNCPEVSCYRCNEKGHIARDCRCVLDEPSDYRRRGGSPTPHSVRFAKSD